MLFAASCILVSLHPSYVASSLIEGNKDISTGLEWIRTWALQVAESDPDTECMSVSTVIIAGNKYKQYITCIYVLWDSAASCYVEQLWGSIIIPFLPHKSHDTVLQQPTSIWQM